MTTCLTTSGAMLAVARGKDWTLARLQQALETKKIHGMMMDDPRWRGLLTVSTTAMEELNKVSDHEPWLPRTDVSQLGMDQGWELNSPFTLAISLLAMDFLSLMEPDCLSLLGRTGGSTARLRLMSWMDNWRQIAIFKASSSLPGALNR